MTRLSSALRNSLEQATNHYERGLPEAQSYLGGRGIPLHVARTFRLGFVANPILGHDHLINRLAIPYLTRAGVVNMKFRCTQGHDCKAVKCAKYMGYGGIGNTVFNPEAILSAPPTYIGIAEGEIDAIILTAMCGIPAIGIPGVSNWKPRYAERFGFEDFERVFIFADQDDSGEGRTFAGMIGKSIDNAVVINLPPGHDVNSYYLEAGTSGILSLVGLSSP